MRRFTKRFMRREFPVVLAAVALLAVGVGG